jgi:hypothetical protein
MIAVVFSNFAWNLLLGVADANKKAQADNGVCLGFNFSADQMLW